MADGDAAPELRPEKKPLNRDTSRLGELTVRTYHESQDKSTYTVRELLNIPNRES